MAQEPKLKIVEPEGQLQFDFTKIYGVFCADRDLKAVKTILKGLAELDTDESLVNQVLNILADSSFGVASALEALKKP